MTSATPHSRDRARRRSGSNRRPVSLLAFAVLAAAFACGDPYLHTNPYDPQTAFEYKIVGPDTVFSAGQYAQYSLQSTPAFSDTAGVWSSSSDQFRPALHGQFQLWFPPLWPNTATVQVTVAIGKFDTTATLSLGGGAPSAKATTMDRRELSRNVVLTQRLTSIQLRCPDSHACDPLAAGAAWSVWVDGFDALGGQITGLTNPATNPSTGTPVATFVSRDTTVASVSPVGIRAATVTARKSGTTWIVATRDLLLDSLRLVVR
jgi:hypothetical protein